MVTSQPCSESCRLSQTSVAENWKANRCPNQLGQQVSSHCHCMRSTGGSAQVLESDIFGFSYQLCHLLTL